MKIAFVLGPWSVSARPLDFNTLFTSPRGLTGTEISLAMNAIEFVRMGHDTTIFTVYQSQQQPTTWEGITLKTYTPGLGGEKFDAVVSLNEPDCLRGIENAFRVCCQYLNDYTYTQPGFEDAVDLWTSPCQMHMEIVSRLMPKPGKWVVLPLGCEPSWYENKKVPGRVVWTSSADRGLHNLLECWPRIKAAVPEATLRAFYNFNYGVVETYEDTNLDARYHKHVIEMGQRIRYMRRAMDRLRPLGVEHVGSISREQMKEELSQAVALGYSCDTVAFSEGFSISIMESCAAGVVPVITDMDCLGSVYSGSGAVIIKTPVRQHLDEFADAVIRGLSDEQFRTQVTTSCTAFAQLHRWADVAKQLEEIINANIKS